MAEIEKVIGEEIETPETEEVDVEVETEDSVPSNTMDKVADAADNFYKNIAEEISDEVLQRMSNRLLDDYKKDRVSRKDWETSYTNNLDLLGLNQREMTRPFRGSASVTHPY